MDPRRGPIEYQIHHMMYAIKLGRFKDALNEAMGLPNMVIRSWFSLPLITHTVIIAYGISTFIHSHVPWIQVTLGLWYHGYLCSKMETYIGSLRFSWALIIWVSISLMFSMIYAGTVEMVFLGACFSIQAVDAVVRRERTRVKLGFIKIRTELFPFVVMLVYHFMEVGSLAFHLCGVTAGFAYAYGFFDMLQPGYRFWSKLEDRLKILEAKFVYSASMVNSHIFFRCTGYKHNSDLLAHILVSDILQFYGQNIFRRAPIDNEVEIENLEQKIEAMWEEDGYHPDDAEYILQCCAGDLVAARDIALTLEDYFLINCALLMNRYYDPNDLFLLQYYTKMDADLCSHSNNREYMKRFFHNNHAYQHRFETSLRYCAYVQEWMKRFFHNNLAYPHRFETSLRSCVYEG